MMEDAGRLLNHRAIHGRFSDPIQGCKTRKAGEKFGMSRFTIVSFEQSLPINQKIPDEVNSHFIFPRWQVVRSFVQV